MVWPDRGSNSQSTTLKASTLTITPWMRYQQHMEIWDFDRIIFASYILYYHIWLRIFSQKVCMHNFYILNGNFAGLPITICRFTYWYWSLIGPFLKELFPFFDEEKNLYAQLLLHFHWKLCMVSFPKDKEWFDLIYCV